MDLKTPLGRVLDHVAQVNYSIRIHPNWPDERHARMAKMDWRMLFWKPEPKLQLCAGCGDTHLPLSCNK